MPGDTEISRRIRRVREDLSMTQAEFAKGIGLKEYQLGEAERGSTRPSGDMLRAIADMYKVNGHWLLTGEGEPWGTPTVQTAPSTVTRPLTKAHVEKRTIHVCKACFGMVDTGATYCRSCGSLLLWGEGENDT